MNALMLVQQVASVGLLAVGVAFLAAGSIGLVRLPDLYCRAHAASKCDSAGAGSLLLGLMLHDGVAFDDLKLVLLVVLVVVSGPTTAHALARTGHHTGLEPWSKGGGGRP